MHTVSCSHDSNANSSLSLIANAEDPIGNVMLRREISPGLILQKETTPLGVLLAIFEVLLYSLHVNLLNCLELSYQSSHQHFTEIRIANALITSSIFHPSPHLFPFSSQLLVLKFVFLQIFNFIPCIFTFSICRILVF